MIPLLGYLFVDTPGNTVESTRDVTGPVTATLVVAALVWFCAWYFGPGRRYAFFLAAACLALWGAAQVQIVSNPSTRCSAAVDGPSQPGAVGRVAGRGGHGDLHGGDGTGRSASPPKRYPRPDHTPGGTEARSEAMTPIEVRFTIHDRALGDDIAQGLLHHRLVACWQRSGPVASHYWWEGERESADEWLYACKTTDTLLDEVVEAVAARHPYEVPEVIATTIVGGRLEYLDWIVAETEDHHEDA